MPSHGADHVIIVLGCAGMAGLARALAARHGCPIIEGIGAAVKLAGMLVALGLETSRCGGCAACPPKALIGAIRNVT